MNGKRRSICRCVRAIRLAPRLRHSYQTPMHLCAFISFSCFSFICVQHEREQYTNNKIVNRIYFIWVQNYYLSFVTLNEFHSILQKYCKFQENMVSSLFSLVDNEMWCDETANSFRTFVMQSDAGQECGNLWMHFLRIQKWCRVLAHVNPIVRWPEPDKSIFCFIPKR